MENTGTVKTSASFPVSLWNEIQEFISGEEMSLSRFLQSSSRLKLKASKIQNVREVLDILDKDEIELLKSLLHKKTGR